MAKRAGTQQIGRAVSDVNRSVVIPSRLLPAHPNFIAAGIKYGVRLQHQRKCQHCGRPALRGKPYCQRHAGKAYASDAFGRGERRILRRMEIVGLIPEALMALPPWQAISTLPTSVRSPLRLRLVLLWAEREAQPLAFAQALRQAQHAAETVAPGHARLAAI